MKSKPSIALVWLETFGNVIFFFVVFFSTPQWVRPQTTASTPNTDPKLPRASKQFQEPLSLEPEGRV